MFFVSGKSFPFCSNRDYFYIDLLLFHRILRCFVLIDFKSNRLKFCDLDSIF
ncbi:MAG: PDDEXK nuclease domain-containing protein [Bacteroidia bacterium]